ncbi:MAG: efflux RND transporter periplasmic adaptor subunit [Bacteroidaceae bacterium]|nr:efflux RND transporter periplasmic adaptor subunit [Bacteroidaceae bacterium]
MRKVFLFCIVMLALAACNGQKTENQTEVEKAENQTIVNSDTTATDTVPESANEENLSLGGVITDDPSHYASVTVLMGGTVGNIAVRPGGHVSKGSVIATLTNPEFVELQQTFLDAAAQTEFLETEYKRQASLNENEAASQKKLQQSKADYLSMKSRKEAAATRLQQLGVNPADIQHNGIVPTLTVKAPISGLVGDITINIGKYVNAGDHICSVIDQNSPMLLLTAFIKNIKDISVGTKLDFTIGVSNGESYEAEICYIDPIVDENSHSIKVYARITNPNDKFRVGMYVRASVRK